MTGSEHASNWVKNANKRLINNVQAAIDTDTAVARNIRYKDKFKSKRQGSLCICFCEPVLYVIDLLLSDN